MLSTPNQLSAIQRFVSRRPPSPRNPAACHHSRGNFETRLAEREELGSDILELGTLSNGRLMSAFPQKRTNSRRLSMSASLIGRLGSSALRLSTNSSVDVAHGLSLLFGLGTKGPSIM